MVVWWVVGEVNLYYAFQQIQEGYTTLDHMIDDRDLQIKELQKQLQNLQSP